LDRRQEEGGGKRKEKGGKNRACYFSGKLIHAVKQIDEARGEGKKEKG